MQGEGGGRGVGDAPLSGPSGPLLGGRPGARARPGGITRRASGPLRTPPPRRPMENRHSHIIPEEQPCKDDLNQNEHQEQTLFFHVSSKMKKGPTPQKAKRGRGYALF